MGEQSKHGINWTTKLRPHSPLRPRECLSLTRQHSKKGSVVELKIWFEQQDLKSWNPAAISTLGAPKVVIKVGNRMASDDRYSGPDSTLQTETCLLYTSP